MEGRSSNPAVDAASCERIGEYIQSHPLESYRQIGAALGITRGAVVRVAKLHGVRRRPGRKPAALAVAVKAIDGACLNPSDETLAGADGPGDETAANAATAGQAVGAADQSSGAVA